LRTPDFESGASIDATAAAQSVKTNQGDAPATRLDPPGPPVQRERIASVHLGPGEDPLDAVLAAWPRLPKAVQIRFATWFPHRWGAIAPDAQRTIAVLVKALVALADVGITPNTLPGNLSDEP
jgi:hypothetical protein